MENNIVVNTMLETVGLKSASNSQTRESTMKRMYRAIEVWVRLKGRTVVRYRCLQSLDSGKYCVQSADFYHDGKNPTELDSDGQFIELFTEQDPAERAGEHDTLEAAIAAHNRDFDAL